ncbi:MAG TPA: energy transducer TonB [Chitinophagales bacterium]|nr:energy transducer TonB [Chitinophagales bacterium]HMU69400.1 energy transducer TonB [Chitinophagales bacterium]HMX03916.1 energy transducer TonB [Chitinophagales bacterium]HMZ87895.1 energy transducer TonB [Chitinophagales bacterium]HNE45871.1 energy transducer TonB [Chitinophagales bacterium]
MKHLFAITALFFTSYCYTQTSTTSYYGDVYLSTKAPQSKAKFSKTTTLAADSTITTVVTDLKNNRIVSSESMKNNEAVGIWLKRHGGQTDTLDYQFDLIYAASTCRESLPGLKNVWADNDSLHYKAPVLKDNESVYAAIGNEVYYPQFAKENAIEGKVFLEFTITETGKIENIIVVRGVHISMDKEAVRTVKTLKFESLPMVNGVVTPLYVKMPLMFTLAD